MYDLHTLNRLLMLVIYNLEEKTRFTEFTTNIYK